MKATDADLRAMACSILQRNGAEMRATGSRELSQPLPRPGTAKISQLQGCNPNVPLSQSLGVGQRDTPGTSTLSGEVANERPYVRIVVALTAHCPDGIDLADWQQAISDAREFVGQWGEQARALGWTARDLFGLAPVADRPSPTFRRLSRYDLTGLIWLLQGRSVMALTEESAAIRTPSGGVAVYRKSNKPAFGPVGDSIEDFGG